MTEDPRAGLPSASKMERVIACPGSHLFEKQLAGKFKLNGEADNDELAERGTRIHKARETGSNLELSPEEDELYKAGLRYEEKLVARWKQTFGFRDDEVTTEIGGPALRLGEGPRELRLWLHNHNLEPLGSGQLDTHYIARREYALVCDWKTAFCTNLTGATGNAQLRMQAVLLWLEKPEIKNLRVSFAKPLFEKSKLDYCDYTEAELKLSYDSIVLALWWGNQPDAQRVPGRHCRYCPCKEYCPEAAAFALLPSSMCDMRAPTAVNLLDEIKALTPEDLVKLWEMKPIVEKIFKAALDRLKAFTEPELASLGLMLPDNGKKWAEISDVRGAFDFLLTKGFTEDELWKLLEMAKGRLVKLQSEKTGQADKWAAAWVDDALDKFISRGNDRPSLRYIK